MALYRYCAAMDRDDRYLWLYRWTCVQVCAVMASLSIFMNEMRLLNNYNDFFFFLLKKEHCYLW